MVKILNLTLLRNLFLLTLFCAMFSACNWFREPAEIAIVLSKHFDNKLYQRFDTAAYRPIFETLLSAERKKLTNPRVLTSFYANNQQLPVLVTRFFANGQLDALEKQIANSKADGFNPQIFWHTELKTALLALKNNKFKNIEEVYPIIARLELSAAEGFLKYYNFNRFGSINPRNFLNRYYIKVKRPDSLGMLELLKTEDLAGRLEEAQKHTSSYQALRQQLAIYRDSLKSEDSPAIKTIKLNMERMRWQMPIESEETVLVNIPDFSLTWFKGDDTLTTMKVCVGGKREPAYAEKMKTYMRTGKLDDKPKNHETPQLISVFDAIQVNPVWNIPASIAKNEIYWMVRKDSNYLVNNNIKVYHKGRLVAYPDTINWAQYPREKLPFSFKQGAGEDNALGKFKFVFNNSSSIYLHDTNNKYAFSLNNRAISHGCVRVEDPLKFAELMIGSKRQFDNLRMDVNLPPLDTTRMDLYQKKLAKKNDTTQVFKLKPSWFGPRKNIRVLIAYYTAWAHNGQVKFRPDVYGYDEMVWAAIKRYM